MELLTRVTGCMGEHKDTATSFTLSETLIKGSGLETRPVGSENTQVQLMEAHIKDSGEMICRMVMESRSGVKIRVSLKVSLSKDSNKASANRYGPMAPFTKGTGSLT